MKQIILTHHAKDRAKEYDLDEELLKRRFTSAKRVKNSIRRSFYKFSKYGDDQQDIEYYFCAGILYTVKVNEKDYVIITVTKRKMNNNQLTRAFP